MAESITLSSPAIPPVSGGYQQPSYLKKIIQTAGKRINLDIDFIVQPAQRSLITTNQGDFDGELHRIAGLETYYPNLIRVPEAVLIDQFIGFSAKPNVKVKDWLDTGNLKIAYPRGWTIFSKAFGEDRMHQPGLNGESLFKMAAHGRIDIAMHTLDKGTYIAQKEGLRLYPVSPPFAIKPMYVYLHKSKAHLIDKLASAIKTVKEDGTYAKIKRQELFRFGLTDKAFFQSPLDKPGS
ncbi:transporter substrate-binding domain-containing protein [Terasakiella sp. SH-1]|uniref:substrate-binding periplasmic protein n=1 Tax=Terasakiella sp. SH-1 TaxID=2560057 RepID=UPI0014313518|nr:transporter substrate-binding domain-containing protein [Terasakiella sp. SH-1]